MQREMQEFEECDYDCLMFLFRVGEGKDKEDEDGRIALPGYINVVEKTQKLIDEVFDGIETEYVDRKWLRARSIFATDNPTVNQLNECDDNRVPGHSKAYLSADSVKANDPDEQVRLQSEFPIEFLNSIEGSSSLPAHELNLKKGFIAMLL